MLLCSKLKKIFLRFSELEAKPHSKRHLERLLRQSLSISGRILAMDQEIKRRIEEIRCLYQRAIAEAHSNVTGK
jgi:hypothetical protein